MGYIHNTSMRFIIPPSFAAGSGGTWVHTLDGTNWYLGRTAGAGNFYLGIPIVVPHQNASENRGSRIASVDVYYQIYTAAMTTLTPEFNLQAWELGGEGFATPTNPAYTADTTHSSNEGRVTTGVHFMNLELNTPLWLEGDTSLRLDLYGVVDANSVFRFWGAQVNYTLRI